MAGLIWLWQQGSGPPPPPPPAVSIDGGVPLWALRREARLRAAAGRKKKRETRRIEGAAPRPPTPPIPPSLFPGAIAAAMANAPAAPIELAPARLTPVADASRDNRDMDEALAAILLSH